MYCLDGFAAPVVVSYDLEQFLGRRIIPRTEVTKLMWAYIKEHNLQNPQNRSEILCDAKLEKLFKRKKVKMFTMTKLLSAVSNLSINWREVRGSANDIMMT